MIEFFLPMEKVPTTTKQQHRISKHGSFYESDKLASARSKIEGALIPWIPKAPLQGPIRLTVKWLFQPPKSQTKPFVWKTSRPDTDNLNKMLKDIMTALQFWNDDAQVCSEIIEKFTVLHNTGIYIKIEQL